MPKYSVYYILCNPSTPFNTKLHTPIVGAKQSYRLVKR